jgi:hypothetical protein
MVTVLFWNLNRRVLLQDLVSLCNNHKVDILILAESMLLDIEILAALNENSSSTFFIALFNQFSTRLSFFIRYPVESVIRVADADGISIRQIIPSSGVNLLLVAVHLPSKLHLNEREQLLHAARVATIIQRAEEEVGHTRTMVIGDFNMNPFESGIVASDGLHAVMTQAIAYKRSRRVRGEQKSFFYNPMWGLMGDSSPGAPGTYYYRGSRYIDYFWNTFDHVLLRPDLLPFFSQEDLSIISEIGTKSLLAQNGILKDSSDHLPIMISLQIEKESDG